MGPLLQKFTGHRDCVYSICQGSGPGDFFSAGADGWVVQWNVQRPEEGKLLARMSGPVYALFHLPERNELLVAVNHDGFHLLNLETGEEIWQLPFPEQKWFRMERHNEGVLCSGTAGWLALFEPETRQTRTWRFGQSDLRGLAVHPDGTQFALGNSAGEIQTFSAPGQAEHPFPAVHNSTVFGLQYYPDGERLVSCGRDARLALWDLQTLGIPKLEKEIPAHLFGIHDVKVHPQKPLLATCSVDKTIKIWDAESLKLLRVLDKTRHAGHGHSVNQVCWLAEPEVLLTCSDDRTLSAWNIYS